MTDAPAPTPATRTLTGTHHAVPSAAAAVTPAAAARARHVDLILNQIDALPTLSPVALRVLRLTGDDNAGTGELASLIQADPALTARILTLCRRADVGVSRSVTSIDRLIVMLGIDTLRSALLSAELYEMFKPSKDHSEDATPAPTGATGFDAAGFWRHSVAVACAAELICESFRDRLPNVRPGEAYLCGLLHDLGKAALERTLPKTYSQVIAIASDGRAELAEVERRVLGVDHHAAGKRLAERWGLPHAIQDAMWLHGRPLSTIPAMTHRELVALIGVADSMARRLHLGFSGNLYALDALESLCMELGLDMARVSALEGTLIARVVERCSALGLEAVTDRDVLLQCLAEANRRFTAASARRVAPPRAPTPTEDACEAIEQFQLEAQQATGFANVAGAVAASCARWFGTPGTTLAWRTRADAPWLIMEFESSQEGTRLRTQRESNSPPGGIALELPIRSGPSGRLVHPAPARTSPPGAMLGAWAMALCAASRHEGALRLSEELAATSQRLSSAERQQARAGAMVNLGELSSVAVQEISTLVSVITDNAGSLARRLTNPGDQRSVSAISRATGRITDLVRTLRLFADHSPVTRAECDMNELVARACKDARERCSLLDSLSPRGASAALSIRASVEPQARFARVGAEQVTGCITELITNAIQAGPRSMIEVRVMADPNDGQLLIMVKDDGRGMSEQELARAGTPIIESRAGVRRTALGLAKCRRYAELHAGTITLSSTPEKGTTATLAIPQWSTLPRTVPKKSAAGARAPVPA